MISVDRGHMWGFSAYGPFAAHAHNGSVRLRRCSVERFCAGVHGFGATASAEMIECCTESCPQVVAVARRAHCMLREVEAEMRNVAEIRKYSTAGVSVGVSGEAHGGATVQLERFYVHGADARNVDITNRSRVTFHLCKLLCQDNAVELRDENCIAVLSHCQGSSTAIACKVDSPGCVQRMLCCRFVGQSTACFAIRSAVVVLVDTVLRGSQKALEHAVVTVARAAFRWHGTHSAV